MSAALIGHIVAGGLGIIAGFVALYSAKGAPLHRRAGMVFVYVMLAMTFSGMLLAIARNAAPSINIPASLLTAYLVITGFLTVRPIARLGRPFHIMAMLVAFAVGTVSLTFGIEAIVKGAGRDDMPAFPFFLFGGVGLLASALDLRMIRSGGVRGVSRLRRHLWRMCFALFIAAMSFFLGQADEIPKALRIPALLATPVLAVLLTMFFWLWRVRPRRGSEGLAAVHYTRHP